MSKTATIRARVEPELKREAETVFARLGMTTTEAITLFYRQVTLHHGMPFELRLPNARTTEALRQAREGDDLLVYRDLDELRAELE